MANTMRRTKLFHRTKRSKHSSFARRFLVSMVALCSIAALLLASSPVAALTQGQRRHYAYEGIEFIDDPCTALLGNDTKVIGSINGSPDAKTLHSKFHQRVIDSFFFFLKEG